MIASLTGTLKVKTPTEVLLDVNGVGYAISIPLSTFEKLGSVESKTTFLTHLHVREDILQLFGFLTEEERYLFKLLISVSGIGPKIAQGILSGISVKELKEYLTRGNVEALMATPGVGRKTAERLIVELRDKVSKPEMAPEATFLASKQQVEIRQEALLALTSLGFNRQIAERAIRQVLTQADGRNLSLEELIRQALKLTSAK